jgi:hypothetical protein
MTLGSVSLAAETFSVSGATPADGSSVSKGSTTLGAGTTVSRSLAPKTDSVLQLRAQCPVKVRGGDAAGRLAEGDKIIDA